MSIAYLPLKWSVWNLNNISYDLCLSNFESASRLTDRAGRKAQKRPEEDNLTSVFNVLE